MNESWWDAWERDVAELRRIADRLNTSTGGEEIR
jgi:hypothetical protein